MRAPRIMAMDASASCKAKLASTAECWAPLTTTASSQQEVQKETTPHADLLQLDACWWHWKCMAMCAMRPGFFLIFFWIEFVPVILYLEFCMDVDRPCLYLPSIYTLQVFKNFWKDCTLDLVLTCIIFTRFVVPYTTEDKYWQQWACSSWTDHSDM